MPNARISQHAILTLKDLALKRKVSMQAILEKAIESYRRQVFLEECHQAFLALKADPQAWRSEIKERELWDRTLKDDLAQD
jgi:hypothetical protein